MIIFRDIFYTSDEISFRAHIGNEILLEAGIEILSGVGTDSKERRMGEYVKRHY